MKYHLSFSHNKLVVSGLILKEDPFKTRSLRNQFLKTPKNSYHETPQNGQKSLKTLIKPSKPLSMLLCNPVLEQWNVNLTERFLTSQHVL